MLLEFSVENFKVFKDRATLSLLPGKSDKLEEYYVANPFPKRRALRMALIYGPNASGKTTLVEALSFIKELVVTPLENKEKTFEKKLKTFLGDEKTAEGVARFSLTFVNKELLYSYSIALDKYSVLKEELKVTKFKEKRSRTSVVYKRKTNREKKIALIEFGKSIKLTKNQKDSLEHNTLWNNTVLGGYLKTNLSITELDSVVNWFLNKLTIVLEPHLPVWPLIIERLENGDIDRHKLINILQRADFRIVDFEIREKEIPPPTLDLLKIIEKITETTVLKEDQETPKIKELFLKHSAGEKAFFLPLPEESSGTVRFLELCCLLSLMEENSVLVVDEIESSLHPELLEHFIKEFLNRKDKTQLIATTHYREFMKSEILREDVLRFTEVKRDGSGDLFSFMDYPSYDRKKIRSIYNAYRIGKLGGVPHTS